MKVVELIDAESGERYRVHPDDVTLIADQPGEDNSCVVTLAGKQLVVEGTTADILKQITQALR